MDSRNFTIGVLSVTGVMLLTAVLVIGSRPPTAIASGMTATGGDYIMTVGTSTSTDEELLYVIDGRTGRLIVYRFNTNRKQIELAQGIDLTQLADKAKQSPTGKSRRRP